MGNSQPEKSKFLQDGYQRAVKTLKPQIRAEVEAEFEQQLRSAPRWRRFWIRHRIKSEIRKRLADKAPCDGLY
jgi:hypothetical protein